jgi:hypothetical protein
MKNYIIAFIILICVVIGGFLLLYEKENSKDEILVVEEYIKNNIKTIATNKPVLGGSWYVLSVTSVPALHSGEVIYEDGHIQSKAKFEYTFDNSTKNITIEKFEVQ